ncbi:MAG: gliding motility-associated C-terminal domain-containing protein [Bacteroidota bacterium]
MFNGTIKTCNATFVGGSLDDDNIVLTFLPATPGARIRVTFSNTDIDDQLFIFNAIDASGKPIDSLNNDYNDDDNFTYTAKNANGALTFVYEWGDAGSQWSATISCITPSTNVKADVDTQPQNVAVCASIASTFTTSASGPTNITYQWQHSNDGTSFADISDTGGYTGTKTPSLTVDGSNPSQAGYYRCRINGDGAVEVTTDDAALAFTPCELKVYNAVSPNNDGKNEIFFIENIDTIPGKKKNTVKIYNRWGEEVFSVHDYNNTTNVFNGTNKNGNKLPSGTYFYKVSFDGGDKDVSGYIDLKY